VLGWLLRLLGLGPAPTPTREGPAALPLEAPRITPAPQPVVTPPKPAPRGTSSAVLQAVGPRATSNPVLQAVPPRAGSAPLLQAIPPRTVSNPVLQAIAPRTTSNPNLQAAPRALSAGTLEAIGGARPPVNPPPPALASGPPPEPMEGEDPFAPFARALGLALPLAPAPLSEEDAALLETLAARLLEHCRKNRLGPASAPTMSLRILNLVASPSAELAEMSRLISADPALSASVLTVANSAFYRGFSEIETVRDAVTRMGLDEVGRVAGALSAKSLFNPKLKQELLAFGPRFGALYRRAITIATASAALAMRTRARSDRCYLGGMLHDVGRTVALRAVSDLSRAGALGVPVDHPLVEQAIDKVHLEIGAELHQEWKLPQYLTVLAVRHHDAAIPAEPEFLDLHVVRIAQAVHDVRTGAPEAARAARELVQSAAQLGLHPNEIRVVAAELKQAEAKAATTFGL
jgi:HD-like signal output (HDOD) protein